MAPHELIQAYIELDVARSAKDHHKETLDSAINAAAKVKRDLIITKLLKVKQLESQARTQMQEAEVHCDKAKAEARESIAEYDKLLKSL